MACDYGMGCCLGEGFLSHGSHEILASVGSRWKHSFCQVGVAAVGAGSRRLYWNLGLRGGGASWVVQGKRGLL